MLLVLHGGPGGDYEGLKVLQSLSNHFFVVFFDQRGSGLSERVHKELLNPMFLLDDINEIADKFSPGKKFFLLGHSWGGSLATFYVQKYPEKVAKLLLAEPGALNKQAAKVANTTAFQFSAKGLHQMLGSHEYLSFDNHNIADYRMALFVNSDVGDYRDFASPDELKRLKYKRFGFISGYEINRWQGNFNEKYDFDFANGIKQSYTGKTLILAAEKSQRLGYDFQKRFHKDLFNNCSVIEIKGAGHYFIELNPELSLPLIESFFRN